MKIRPLTAIAISIIIITVSFGIGRFVLPFKIPFFEYASKITPTPAPDGIEYRDTAFSGTLRHTPLTSRYYLITSLSEAINLEVPDNIELKDFVGRRIFATGKYYEQTRTLLVTDAEDLELLPEEIEAIPTIELTPTQVPEDTLTPADTSDEITP